MYNIIIFIVCFLFVCSASAQDISGAIEAAYKHNYKIKSEMESYNVAKANKYKAVSGFVPNVSVNASNVYHVDHVGLALPAPYKDYDRLFNLHADYAVNIGGASYHNYMRAKHAVHAARHMVSARRSEVTIDAVNAYMGVIAAREYVKLSKSNVRVLTSHLDMTNDRFALGEVTKTDVAQIKARLSQARAKQLQYEGEHMNVIAHYVKTIGEDPVDLQMPYSLPILPDSLEKALILAKKHNPQVKGAMAGHKSGQYALRAATAMYFPNILVDYGRYYDRNTMSLVPSNSRTTITLNLPLVYKGGVNIGSYQEAKSSAHKLLYDYEEAMAALQESVVSAINNVETARANVAASKDMVDASSVALEGIRQECQLGSRTTIELLNAEQEHFSAKVGLISAERALVSAVYYAACIMGIFDDV